MFKRESLIKTYQSNSQFIFLSKVKSFLFPKNHSYGQFLEVFLSTNGLKTTLQILQAFENFVG